MNASIMSNNANRPVFTIGQRRKAQRAMEFSNMRMLAYCFVLTLAGGFVGAFTNDVRFMALGFVPGLATLGCVCLLAHTHRNLKVFELSVPECDKLRDDFALIVACGAVFTFWLSASIAQVMA